jgi:hypothetical protein
MCNYGGRSIWVRIESSFPINLINEIKFQFNLSVIPSPELQVLYTVTAAVPRAIFFWWVQSEILSEPHSGEEGGCHDTATGHFHNVKQREYVTSKEGTS